MFIYWGYPCGGKRHMKKYAHINNKTYLMWCHHGHWIRKRKVTTNYYENDWSDETMNEFTIISICLLYTSDAADE